MKQHIKRGIRLAGLNLSAVKFSKTKHVRLTLPNGGAKVTTSCSPRDTDTAAKRIAIDIRAAMEVAA